MRYHYVPESDAAHEAYDPWTAERPPFPAPEVTSRDPWPKGWVMPAAALSLASDARGWGWQAVTQYARGQMPHAITGRPGTPAHTVAVRLGGHARTDRQAYAVYRSPVSRPAWTWSSVQIWGPDLPPFGQCGVTELREWLSLAGDVPRLWFSGIALRREEQALRARQSAAARPKKSTREAGG
jgi:hypothetical protein